MMENGTQGIGFSRFLENYEIHEDEIDILLPDLGKAEGEHDPEDFKISLGGETLEVTDVSTVEAEKLPVTVYCLVDVSGSMKEEQMEQVKEMLLAIRSSMTGNDNMVICTMGNETQSSGFLQAGEELDNAINALESGKEDTNLYQGIADSIRILQTDRKVHTKRCLLILSDGDDEQVSGITEQEAKQAVMDAKIPVYTMATLRRTQSEEQLEYAKLLGSFSRLSVGGQYYAPMLEERTAGEAGDSMMRSLKGGTVVSARIGEMPSGKDLLLLRVAYEADEDTVLEDTMELYAEDLPVRETEEETEEAADETLGSETVVSEEIPSGAFVSEPAQGGVVHFLPAVGAVLFLICAVFLAFRLKRRNRKGYWNAASSQSVATDEKTGVMSPSRRAGEDDEEATVIKDDDEATVLEGGMRMELRAVDDSDAVYPLLLEEGREITLGRNQNADVVLDKNDRTISGTHCKISSVRGKIMLEDLQSTNGTLLNGTSIRDRGAMELREGDVLKIGHTRYRLHSVEGKR